MGIVFGIDIKRNMLEHCSNMEQTIVQIGNSYGVIIPKKFIKELNLKKGEKVIVEKTIDAKLTIDKVSKNKKANATYTSSITPEILRIMDRVDQEYGAAFAELARK